MAEAPISLLYAKPDNKPKPKEKWYRRDACTMSQFRSLSHRNQMRLDDFLSEGQVYEKHPDPVYGKPYWVSKRKPKA